ncbi:MAG: PilZ domain-containing protein [Myxococcota bacterium]
MDTRLPVVETASGGATYYTKNLSMGGLFLLSEKRWPVGSELNLTIAFGRARLPINARVTHLQRDGVGMCFMEPSDAVREALRLLIASQIPVNEPSRAGAIARAVGLGGGPSVVIAWSDGKLRHEATVRRLTMHGGFFETPDRPDIGSNIMVYVPSSFENEDAEIEHELRGCSAEVTAHSEEGFDARFTVPSAEFRMALERLLRELPAT